MRIALSKQSTTFLTSLIVLLTISTQSFADSTTCMTKAIYFESRGGSDKDMLAVGHTIMNRVKSKSFPNTVCAVVNQRSQFSPHIRKGSSMKETKSVAKSKDLARKVISKTSKDFTNGATYFHTPAVRPGWAGRFKRVYTNSQHYFYKPH